MYFPLMNCVKTCLNHCTDGTVEAWTQEADRPEEVETSTPDPTGSERLVEGQGEHGIIGERMTTVGRPVCSSTPGHSRHQSQAVLSLLCQKCPPLGAVPHPSLTPLQAQLAQPSAPSLLTNPPTAILLLTLNSSAIIISIIHLAINHICLATSLLYVLSCYLEAQFV